jgi:hypothetical protein
MPYTPGHVPVQFVQPGAAGYYDPNQQQPCVPQQMQHPQQGTSFYSQIPQVQSLTPYSVHSSYTHLIEHQQYATSFPALPDRIESPWRKVEYKKRPRDNPEALTQNVKQIKLNVSWLKSPLPQTANRFDVLTHEMSGEGGVKQPEPLPKHHPYLCQESRIYNHSKSCWSL